MGVYHMTCILSFFASNSEFSSFVVVGDSGAIVHDYGQRHQGVVESTRVPGQAGSRKIPYFTAPCAACTVRYLHHFTFTPPQLPS